MESAHRPGPDPKGPDREGPDPPRNRDFDGYILDLIDRMDDPTLRSCIRGMISGLKSELDTDEDGKLLAALKRIGGEEIPTLLCENNWPPQRSKAILYSYIAAFQAGKSHVNFAERLVMAADTEALREVFASLIAAWDLLPAAIRCNYVIEHL